MTLPYPREAVDEALGRISSQGLWLLLSLDHYAWRFEYDEIETLLRRPSPGHDHFAEHAPLAAIAPLFVLVDKLWRLAYGIRAHRAGREFLNTEDGYLAGGYRLHSKLGEMRAIKADEWREILAVPDANTIRTHLLAAGADDDEVSVRLEFAAHIPALLATNMAELEQYVERGDALTGPLEKTNSLRDLDDKHRHGSPIIYHDCAPTDAGWIDVAPIEGVGTADTVGLIATPPDAHGAALILLTKHDEEMIEGTLGAAATLACLVRRLVRAHLATLAPGLVDPLAAVADYEV